MEIECECCASVSLVGLLYSLYVPSESPSCWLVMVAHLYFTVREVWSVPIGWEHSPCLSHCFLVDFLSRVKIFVVVILRLLCVHIWLDSPVVTLNLFKSDVALLYSVR